VHNIVIAVTTHVRNILDKPHLANLTQAALCAVDRGLAPKALTHQSPLGSQCVLSSEISRQPFCDGPASTVSFCAHRRSSPGAEPQEKP